jgi:hypothetical protein
MKNLIWSTIIYLVLVIFFLLLVSPYQIIEFEVCKGILIGSLIASIIIPTLFWFICEFEKYKKIKRFLKNLILISIFFLPFNSFSQETELYFNFEELKEENVTYEIYIAVDLWGESRVYRYRIDDETINDIIIESSKKYQKIPIEIEFKYEQNSEIAFIEIWYVIKSKNNFVEGEFKEKIKRCKKNFLKFKKTFYGIKVKQYKDFHEDVKK